MGSYRQFLFIAALGGALFVQASPAAADAIDLSTASVISSGALPPAGRLSGLVVSTQAALTAYNNIFNPAKGQKATLKYEVQSPGHLTIRLYTLNGSLVATIFDGPVPAGKGSVDWFGSNAAGHRVASGIYLVNMSGPGFSKTQKIVVVK